MIHKLTLTCIIITAIATISGANTFTAEGDVLEPTHGYNTIADRALVNDGSFEGGTCQDEPIWTCTTSSAPNCDWIADLVPIGLWNYDGNHIAWLGGNCTGPTEFTYICQDVDLGIGLLLSWYWMAYTNDSGNLVTVTIDDNIVFSYTTALADHLLDYQQIFIDISGFGGVHTLCFKYDRSVGVDNYFVDFVEFHDDTTPTETANFSIVKSLY